MPDQKTVQVAVVGGGIAGIEAAKKLGSLKTSPVVLVEKGEDSLGGYVLHQGMMYLRFLMGQYQHTQGKPLYQEVRSQWKEFQHSLRKKFRTTLEQNDVSLVYGEALFREPFVFGVGDSIYRCENVILATGSRWEKPVQLVGDPDAWGTWETLPQSVVILGGEKESCEVAYHLALFGCQVILVERNAIFLSEEGEKSRMEVRGLLSTVGVHIYEGMELREALKTSYGWRIELEDSLGNSRLLESEALLVFWGREGVSPLELERDDQTGGIKVSKTYQTSINGVFAVGDMIHPGSEAHVAKREGCVAAENLFLQKMPPLVPTVQLHKDIIRYDVVPGVSYFDYPLASVGMRIEEARQRFQPFELQVISRSWPLFGPENREAWVSLLLHKVRQHILGVVAYGPSAESLVHLFSLAMMKGVRFHEIGEVMYTVGSLEDLVGEIALEI
ncbi:FAD-dependent oxidoreductase [Thermospira aquatica]|uniref:NAD(P)/FAD-dependent oxidoreductase n=1 Tax=Thermospira aquatica TaxID=2828656 RepID=A0AAX3BEI2_9SPIR|nr:FAD-dependent oxidoreductase [Thermospira aquatica]URA10171.1 NAD(P)/FAD-dependent oxidoreductase [Thermospira aquatica]